MAKITGMDNLNVLCGKIYYGNFLNEFYRSERNPWNIIQLPDLQFEFQIIFR